MRKIILLSLFFAITHLYALGSKEVVSHVVQPHETIFRISLMYNSTVTDIVQANPGIKPNEVRSGMTIKVPKDTKVRDAAFVAMFLKTPHASMPHELEAGQRDENPFMGASGQGKTIDQIVQSSAGTIPASQRESRPAAARHKTMPVTVSQPYSSEDLRNRYLELKDQAAYDNNIKVIDINRIKVATETAAANK